MTPSITHTSSVTPTSSITPTSSVTPTITPSVSPVQQNLLIDDDGNYIITDDNDFLVMTTGPLPSPTPSKTVTPTSTTTPSITPSISVSLTPSITPTSTITSTPSVTKTVTPSITPSVVSPISSNLLVNLDARNTSSYPGTGTLWTDLQGNNNGTLVNGPTYNSTEKSIVTDGIDDYILLSNVAGTGNAAQSFTYELWVKPDDADGNIMSMSQSNPQTGWNMPPIVADAGRFRGKIWQNNYLYSTTPFNQGQWYQVVLVWDFANTTQSLYIDGVLNDSQTGVSYLSSGVNNNIFFGQQNPGADNTGDFSGEYGIIRLYNSALTSSQVLNNFNATNPYYIAPSPTPTSTQTPTVTPSSSITPSVTPSSSVSVSPSITPTPSITPSVTPTLSITPTNSLTPTQTSTPTPTVTPTNTITPTPTVTPSVTPSVTSSPIPVTGYGYNLVATPYQVPTSGNTIISNNNGGGVSGSTDPNSFNVGPGIEGIYWNKIDKDGVDRDSYYSSFVGNCVRMTISQNGSTAIYDGTLEDVEGQGTPYGGWTGGTQDTGYYFRGNGGSQVQLVQSATTQWVIGDTVYISLETLPCPTPTPTPTPSVTTTVTPSISVSPTPSSSVVSSSVWQLRRIIDPSVNCNIDTSIIYRANNTLGAVSSEYIKGTDGFCYLVVSESPGTVNITMSAGPYIVCSSCLT